MVMLIEKVWVEWVTVSIRRKDTLLEAKQTKLGGNAGINDLRSEEKQKCESHVANELLRYKSLVRLQDMAQQCTATQR